MRMHIEPLANEATGDELLNELQQMWAEVDEDKGGSSWGYKFDREELYAERLNARHAAVT